MSAIVTICQTRPIPEFRIGHDASIIMRFAVVVDTTIELCQQIVDCTMEQRNLLCRHLPYNGVIDRVISVGYLIPHVYKTTKIRNGRGCLRVQFMSLIKCFTYDLEKLV